MRNLVFIMFLLLFTVSITYSQSPVPNGFSYQAVVRDGKGLLRKGANVELRFSLLPGQSATTPTYVETQVARTDSFGVCAVVIGQGTKTGGTAPSFGAVDFGIANYWLNIELKDGANWALISKQQLLSVPYAQVARKVVQDVSPIPAGTIMAFGGNSTKIPEGWLLCDGREVDRSKYNNLWNTIGANWGRGNNSTTFHLPDLRGEFLRGVSSESGIDQDAGTRFNKAVGGNVGNEVGSYQPYQIQYHNHPVGVGTGDSYSMVLGKQNLPRLLSFLDDDFNRNDQGKKTTDSIGGSETRPRNAYVYYIIKY